MQTILIFVVTLATLATADSCQNCPQDCIPFNDCAEAVKIHEAGVMEFYAEIQFFKSLECGVSKRRDKILCNEVKKKHAELFGSAPDPSPSIDHCGNWNPTQKITGGKFTDLDEFPWMALIRTINKIRRIQIICGGSLITEKYVLTAAHCLDLDEEKRGKLHSVILGEYDIRSEKDCIAEGDCADPVQKFSIHSYKTYRPGTHMHDDIGLVRLNGTADLSTDFVKPICLPPADFPPLRKDDPLWISGWGRNENTSLSDIKLKAQIFYLTKEDCYKKIHYRPQNSEICAGAENKTDACSGDSGGPLMALQNYKDNERIFLVGIISWGIGCGGVAAIYTKVSHYRDWILENIRK